MCPYREMNHFSELPCKVNSKLEQWHLKMSNINKCEALCELLGHLFVHTEIITGNLCVTVHYWNKMEKYLIFSEVFIIHNGLLKNSGHFEAGFKVSLFFPQLYFTKFIYLKMFICNSKITSKTFKYENRIIVVLLYFSLTIMFEKILTVYIFQLHAASSQVFLSIGYIRFISQLWGRLEIISFKMSSTFSGI